MSNDLPCPLPIFQLFIDGGKIEIYANGNVEGWPHNGPRLEGISNYLPMLLTSDQLSRFSKPRQSSELKSPTSNVAPIGESHS